MSSVYTILAICMYMSMGYPVLVLIHDRVRRSWRHLDFFRFEALALSLGRQLPVSQAANRLRVAYKRLWRRIRHYVAAALAQDDMVGVRRVGVDEPSVKAALNKWMNWARRSRLEPFKRLACTLKTHLGGVVRGMLGGRCNAYVEAMNGLLQQTKRAALGFRDVQNFIAIAYLRMSKLKHLPKNPLVLAIPREYGRYRHVC